MSDPGQNVVQLDLSRFSDSDVQAILALGEKQKLLYRWFRTERNTEAGLDQYCIYSGARTKTPYAAYRIERHRDGEYRLCRHKTDEELIRSRSIHAVIEAIPDDFFYSI